MIVLEKGKFASMEERYFQLWIDELEEAGMIDTEEYQPFTAEIAPTKTFKFRKVLKTKTKIEEFNLMQPLRYTPDWELQFSNHFKDLLGCNIQDVYDSAWTKKKPLFVLTDGIWILDVKGSHDPFGDGRNFTFNQKLLMHNCNKYSQKVEMSNEKGSFFDKTFTPKRFLYTDKSFSRRKLKYKAVNLQEFILSLK